MTKVFESDKFISGLASYFGLRRCVLSMTGIKGIQLCCALLNRSSINCVYILTRRNFINEICKMPVFKMSEVPKRIMLGILASRYQESCRKCWNLFAIQSSTKWPNDTFHSCRCRYYYLLPNNLSHKSIVREVNYAEFKVFSNRTKNFENLVD